MVDEDICHQSNTDESPIGSVLSSLLDVFGLEMEDFFVAQVLDSSEELEKDGTIEGRETAVQTNMKSEPAIKSAPLEYLAPLTFRDSIDTRPRAATEPMGQSVDGGSRLSRLYFLPDRRD